MQCETCKWHFADACRRYPPHVTVFVAEGRHALTGQPRMMQNVVSAYPPVKPDQWCGEYALKVELLS